MKDKFMKVWKFIIEAIGFYFILVTLFNVLYPTPKEAFAMANIAYIFIAICVIIYFIKERK